MEIGGFANQMLHVDMTAGSVEVKEIPEDWARLYIGARGLGVRYVFENGPQVDPLSPENILCFMNGPLTGTAANMSGRMAVVTKSLLTNTVCDSHHGGWSAARLRWAGYDGIVVTGKAENQAIFTSIKKALNCAMLLRFGARMSTRQSSIFRICMAKKT